MACGFLMEVWVAETVSQENHHISLTTDMSSLIGSIESVVDAAALDIVVNESPNVKS